MRAQEFVGEKVAISTAQNGFKHRELVNDDAWTITAEGETRQYGSHTANVLHIRVIDNQTQDELAWVDFMVKTRPDGEQYLESVYTHVKPRYRGQGLAKLMYKYANGLGNDILPSALQTDLGKGMWKGLTGKVRQPPPEVTPPEPVRQSWWQKFRKATV